MKITLKGIKLGLATSIIGVLPNLASAAANLESDDFVGISFWLISMALVAATAFFFIETQRVEGKWKTSLTVSGLVTLVAAVHYFYMRDVWVATGLPLYRLADHSSSPNGRVLSHPSCDHSRFWWCFLETDDWHVCHAGRRLYG